MFLRLVLHSLLRRRRRKTAALLAVALGVGAAGGLFLLLVGVGDEVAAEMSSYRANLVIEPLVKGGTLDEDGMQRLSERRWHNQITAAAPVLKVAGTPPLWGTRFSKLQGLSKSWKVEGRWPRNSSEALAGEDLGLPVGTRKRGFTIVGVVSSGGPADDVLIVDLARAQAIAGKPGRISEVFVSAVTTPESTLLSKRYGADPKSMKPSDYERYVCTSFPTTVAMNLAGAFRGATGRPIRAVTESESALVNKTKGWLLALAVAALAAAVLGVLGAMTAIVVERRREVGLLKALGATTGRVVALFVSEACLLGVLGSVLGYGVALLLAKSLSLTLFHHAAAGSPVVYLLMLLLAIVVAVAGTVIPLRTVLRVEPSRVLHES